MKNIHAVLILSIALFSSAIAQTKTDAALRQVTDLDAGAASTPTLPAAEHLRRAEVYSSNRLFPQARAHWQKILDVYPTDAGMPKVLLGIGRSYMWERDYAKAITFFDRATRSFIDTKEGRESLAFTGACYVRLGKNIEAAHTYERYTAMFPAGERIETSYLNIIDAYREAGKYNEANQWVDRTIAKFAGKPTSLNALHARVRMEIHRERWTDAVAAADDLLSRTGFGPSMTSVDEVKYLKGFALEKAGRKGDAAAVYSSIPLSYSSYFSGLAAAKSADKGIRKTADVSANLYGDYPVLYRAELLKNAKSRSIDPRFVLAIMKQESTFRATAKSPAGARGLLQLVFDTAIKYTKDAGYSKLDPDDLYRPSVNIAVGSEYIADLKDEFGGLYEAIAASYNGGEDNAARWLNRSKPKDPGIFTAEIGFAETKAYVGKVMNNYRIYQDLYDENLNRR